MTNIRIKIENRTATRTDWKAAWSSARGHIRNGRDPYWSTFGDIADILRSRSAGPSESIAIAIARRAVDKAWIMPAVRLALDPVRKARAIADIVSTSSASIGSAAAMSSSSAYLDEIMMQDRLAGLKALANHRVLTGSRNQTALVAGLREARM